MDEWGPWKEHIQGACPVDPDAIVRCEMGHTGSGDIIGPMPAADIDWNFPGDPVARYQVMRPPSLAFDTLAGIAANPPAKPIRERRPERVLG